MIEVRKTSHIRRQKATRRDGNGRARGTKTSLIRRQKATRRDGNNMIEARINVAYTPYKRDTS